MLQIQVPSNICECGSTIGWINSELIKKFETPDIICECGAVIKLIDFEGLIEIIQVPCGATIGLIEKPAPSNICECGARIEQIDNERVCLSCGLHHGYENATEYVDYYKNMYRIRKKSIYKRKYYQEKVIERYNLPNERRSEFQSYFNKIEDVYSENTFYKKRMISFNYLFRKVFEMMGLKKQMDMCKQVRDKKVLEKYDEVWKTICEFNGW